jgi:hypothetical protein
MAFGLGTFGSGGLGDMLSSQVGDETDELRKKRLQDMQSLMGQMGSMGGGGDSNSLFGTLNNSVFNQRASEYVGRFVGNLRRSLSGGMR